MSIQQSVNNMLATAAVVGGVAKHGIEEQKKTDLSTIEEAKRLIGEASDIKTDVEQSELNKDLNFNQLGVNQGELNVAEKQRESLADDIDLARAQGKDIYNVGIKDKGKLTTLGNKYDEVNQTIVDKKNEINQRLHAYDELNVKIDALRERQALVEAQKKTLIESKQYKNAIKRLGGK